MALSRWIDEHLETFVKPRLGYIPNKDATTRQQLSFNPTQLAGLHALWIQAKRKAAGRTILLPGRDVFLFEILARMEGWDTIFRPDISSCTYNYFYNIYPEMKAKFKETLCVDTGYRGSVPIGLGIANFLLISASSCSPQDKPKRQIFPNCIAGPCVSLSGVLEGTPKYWITAQMAATMKTINQPYASAPEFERAAILARHIAESAYIGSKLNKLTRRVL